MKHLVQAEIDLLAKLVAAKYGDNHRAKFAVDLGVTETTVIKMLSGHVPGEPIRKLAAVLLNVDVGRIYRSKKAA
jgi:hypothetical protein